MCGVCQREHSAASHQSADLLLCLFCRGDSTCVVSTFPVTLSRRKGLVWRHTATFCAAAMTSATQSALSAHKGTHVQHVHSMHSINAEECNLSERSITNATLLVKVLPSQHRHREKTQTLSVTEPDVNEAIKVCVVLTTILTHFPEFLFPKETTWTACFCPLALDSPLASGHP